MDDLGPDMSVINSPNLITSASVPSELQLSHLLDFLLLLFFGDVFFS